MINMGGAQQHRSYHRAHLTTRVRSTHPAAQPHRPIHQPFQTQPHYQALRGIVGWWVEILGMGVRPRWNR